MYKDRYRGLSLRLMVVGRAKDEAAVGMWVVSPLTSCLLLGDRACGWAERMGTHGRRSERMGVIRDLLIRATEKARHPQQARQFQNRHQCRREVGQRGGI